MLREEITIKGLIISKIKGFYNIQEEKEGKVYQCKLRGLLKKSNKKENCVTGDIVTFTEDGFITKVEKRKNIIKRPLVANIDYLVIQFSAMDPKFDFGRFNILLLNAFYYKIKPVAVINKIELASEKELEEIKVSLDFLKSLDIDTFYVSTIKETNLNSFKEYIKDKITAFGGPSGVGKSSLLNLLQDKLTLEVGETSKKNSRGRHTTKGTTLLPLPSGGFVIDTPGFSSLELPPIKDVAELGNLFFDFDSFRSCKYNDCTHTHEPGCVIKENIQEPQLGSQFISKLRYDFYLWCIEFYEKEVWNKY